LKRIRGDRGIEDYVPERGKKKKGRGRERLRE
jgi:hypothetical protein